MRIVGGDGIDKETETIVRKIGGDEIDKETETIMRKTDFLYLFFSL